METVSFSPAPEELMLASGGISLNLGWFSAPMEAALTRCFTDAELLKHQNFFF